MFPPGTQVRSKSHDWTKGLVGEVIGPFNSEISTVRFVAEQRAHYGNVQTVDNREHCMFRIAYSNFVEARGEFQTR